MSIAKQPLMIDRDESTLAFNARVLDMAHRDDIPLLERLSYLCIVSSNLDEFFEVRVALHLHQIGNTSEQAPYSQLTFEKISRAAHLLVEQQYRLFNEELMPVLKKQDLHLITHDERNTAQHKWVKQYFYREVRPLLNPVSLGKV